MMAALTNVKTERHQEVIRQLFQMGDVNIQAPSGDKIELVRLPGAYVHDVRFCCDWSPPLGMASLLYYELSLCPAFPLHLIVFLRLLFQPEFLR